jgi:hypothetical protein
MPTTCGSIGKVSIHAGTFIASKMLKSWGILASRKRGSARRRQVRSIGTAIHPWESWCYLSAKSAESILAGVWLSEEQRRWPIYGATKAARSNEEQEQEDKGLQKILQTDWSCDQGKSRRGRIVVWPLPITN